MILFFLLPDGLQVLTLEWLLRLTNILLIWILISKTLGYTVNSLTVAENITKHTIFSVYYC